MRRSRTGLLTARDGLSQGAAIFCLLLLAAIALVGPSGILAWKENQELLEHREEQLAQLTGERDRLRNRVQLLNPNHADADLAGELLRRQLNVAHPDEMVMLLD